MKTTTEMKPNPSFKQACVSSCKRVLTQINNVRRNILREFQQTFQAPEHMLQLAINEAEALAWESGFPQLVFPDLAKEKAQAVVAWQKRQEAIRTRALPTLQWSPTAH